MCRLLESHHVTCKVIQLSIWFTGGAAIGLSVICAPFVAPAFRKYCLPYVPATNNQINNIVKLLKANTNERLLDIGSGDGRIVIGKPKINQFHRKESIRVNCVGFIFSGCKKWSEGRRSWAEYLVGSIFTFVGIVPWCFQTDEILSKGSVEIWCFTLQTHRDLWRWTNG